MGSGGDGLMRLTRLVQSFVISLLSRFQFKGFGGPCGTLFSCVSTADDNVGSFREIICDC